MPTSSGPERSWATLRASWLVFEDEAVLALNKPAGIPVIGERGGINLLALARGGGEILRPVHRIDRITSGLVLFAKEPRAHASLSRQLARRLLGRTYLAIVRSGGLPARGAIDLPLTAGRKGRVRVAAPRASIAFDAAHQRWSVASAEILAGRRIYPSLTLFARVWESAEHTLVVVRPITGRRHQIRVHFAWIGYPVEGDPLFPSGMRRPPRGRASTPGAWRSMRSGEMASASQSRRHQVRTSGNRYTAVSPSLSGQLSWNGHTVRLRNSPSFRSAGGSCLSHGRPAARRDDAERLGLAGFRRGYRTEREGSFRHRVVGSPAGREAHRAERPARSPDERHRSRPGTAARRTAHSVARPRGGGAVQDRPGEIAPESSRRARRDRPRRVRQRNRSCSSGARRESQSVSRPSSLLPRRPGRGPSRRSAPDDGRRASGPTSGLTLMIARRARRLYPPEELP